MMPFVVGQIPPDTPPASIKHISHSSETRDLRPGDVVETLDHILQWDENCVSEEVCERYRQLLTNCETHQNVALIDGACEAILCVTPPLESSFRPPPPAQVMISSQLSILSFLITRDQDPHEISGRKS